MKKTFTVNIKTKQLLYILLFCMYSALSYGKDSPSTHLVGGKLTLDIITVSLNEIGGGKPTLATYTAPATFSLTNTGNNTTSGYTTRYILVNNTTNQIAYVSNTPSFSSILVGNYSAYAVNYNTSGTAPNLAVGTSYTSIGGTCQDISTAFPVIVNTQTNSACTNVTYGANMTATASGNNTSAGYTTVYVDASGSIISSNTTGAFPAPSSVTTRNIYAVNYNTSGTAPTLTAGTLISNIGGTCVATSQPKCFNITGAPTCTPVLAGGTMSATTTGNNTSAGYATVFVLTDANGSIITTNSSGSFVAPATAGTYNIYVVNYNTAATPLPTFTAGTLIGNIGGACASTTGPKCFTVSCPSPTVSVNGSSTATICSGGNASLSATGCTGTVTWNPGNLQGTTQTVNPASTTNYTATCTTGTCVSSASTPVTVNVTTPTIPTITASGTTALCNGQTVNLTASNCSGTLNWSKDGVVVSSGVNPYTAISAGSYTATCTLSGCTSSPSTAVIVTVTTPSSPTITAGGNTALCTNQSVNLTASNCSGTLTWSKDGSVVSTGVNPYTANAAGSYTATCTVNGCVSGSSTAVVVTVTTPSSPTITAGGNTALCTNQSVNLTASNCSGTLTWSKDGVVVSSGVNPYTANAAGSYTATCTVNGCVSGSSTAVVVTVTTPSSPTITAGGNTALCTNQSVNLTASNCSGTLTWSKDGVVVSSGVNPYTANAAGSYTATCTVNGCVSSASTAVNVTQSSPQTPTVSGTTTITSCTTTGATLTATGCTGTVTWNPGSISGATVNVNPATTTSYTATCTVNGCVSPVSATVVISKAPCANTDNATAPFGTPITIPVLSNDKNPDGTLADLTKVTTPVISTQPTKGTVVVNPDGTIKYTPNSGATGTDTFTYTICDKLNPTVCTTTTTTVNITPNLPEYNPDFNVAQKGTPVNGNVSTNDKDVPTGTTYGNPVPVSGNPSSCVPVMSSNGTYTFTCTTPGDYNFNVPVCPPGVTVNCPTVPLKITVTDPTAPTSNGPISNPDYATTPSGLPTTVKTLANDASGNPNTTLNPGSVTITSPPSNGTASVNPTTGDITYTPNSGFTGTDVLTYRVCDNANPQKCTTTQQYITVTPTGTTTNTTTAVDDYNKTPINIPVSGTVKTNDSDPQGNSQTVTPQTTTQIGKGTLVLNSDGTYTFTPTTGYTGVVDYPYTTCDNGTPQACATATLHITINGPIIDPDARLQLKVFLQGAFFSPSGAADALMRDDLRAKGVIPTTEPYTAMANSRFTKVSDAGGQTIGAGVLNVTGNDAIVDWVFVELRNASNAGSVVQTVSALVQRDGDVVQSTDGVTPLTFTGKAGQSYYVSVKHRNHLGAMTATAIPLTSTGTVVDFTTMTAAQTWDSGNVLADGSLGTYNGSEQVVLGNGKMGLWAGNARNTDNKVKYTGLNPDPASIFTQVLNYPTNATRLYNYDFVTPVYMTGDINLDAKVKYAGLSTDTAFILFNVINKYPNNLASKLYNFDFMVEQIP